MRTFRLAVGLLMLVGLTACSRSFWERPRVAGRMQPSPQAAVPQPQPRYATPPATQRPPASVPSQVPSQAPPRDTRAEERMVLQHVNDIRRSQGLSPLRWNETLYACARAHSQEQCRCGYMGHESPDPARRTLVQRMHLAGYQGQMYGEVVAWGYDDAQSVVEGWMNSRDHRAILVDREMQEAAFSRVGEYWTGNFGTPRIAPPARYGPPANPPASSYAPSAPTPPRTYQPALRSPTTTRVQPRQPVQQYFAPVQPAPRPAPRYRPPARGG